MRRLLIVGFLFIGLMGVVGCNTKPAPKPKPQVDLVNGITPVSDDLRDMRATLYQLAQLPPEQRTARLRQDWPHLEESLAYFLRTNGKIPNGAEIESIDFRFGSAQQVRAEDRSGTMHDGYFQNQLVARIHFRGRNETQDVIVQCLNGMFLLPNQYGALQALGTYAPELRFTIGRREGLVHHVDFKTAVDIAERFRLSMFRGKRMKEQKAIDYATARALESRTDWEQITVKVFTGDRFDLVAMTYTPAPRAKPVVKGKKPMVKAETPAKHRR